MLVFALSTPIWLLGAVSRRQLSADLPVSSFIWVTPALAASIVVYRENGAAGVAALLRRAFDHRRIRARIWYTSVILLVPGIHALTYGVMRLTGSPLPTLRLPVLAAVGVFLGYFVAAQFEELGWSGYALDSMQARWNALQASVLLGLVWAVFHCVPLIQHGRSAGWIAWWALSTVAFRVLITWIYNNTGKSVFAAAMTHAVMNLVWIGPFQDFGPSGYPYHAQRISALIMAVAAAIIAVAWGPRTLARDSMPDAAHALRGPAAHLPCSSPSTTKNALRPPTSAPRVRIPPSRRRTASQGAAYASPPRPTPPAAHSWSVSAAATLRLPLAISSPVDPGLGGGCDGR